ncbi:MAG: hypothetical protein RLO81_01080 [Fulvivirga sp.]|uniref:hypothetical protein n=1 Tax=Fulvivirga sp. TaxID=1931237 RepID=UPI0032EED49F
MKKLESTLLLILFSVIATFGGEQPAPVQASHEDIEKIKTDVWQPFMESYRDLDITKFKSIHDENLLRVTINENRIERGSEYFDNVERFLGFVKANNKSIDISFAILSTAIKGDDGYQTGYYRLRSINAEGEYVVRNYGLFNVALKKVDGVWKLTMDSDKSVQLSDDEYSNVKIQYALF